jgi:NAD(P)-dependent dehydrogenase (short-subunit alcohol dehydrogenase family)
MQSNPYDLQPLFRLDGQVAAVTGGAGVLCSAMGHVLAASGAKVVLLDRFADKAEEVAQGICAAGGSAVGMGCDVLKKDSMEAVCEQVVSQFGRVDILINGAGGNHPGATTSAETPFFDLDVTAVEKVFGLNFNGTFLSSQVFAKQMAKQKSGVILNIASMNSIRPLTRIPAYSAAKAAVVNFTQWLAVHMAQEYSPEIRVNALAPGFFLTDQNRFLLKNQETGENTARGKQILDHTPMNRLGEPSDLFGAMLWLVSPAASFVTGIIVPVDGGFSAYSGV